MRGKRIKYHIFEKAGKERVRRSECKHNPHTIARIQEIERARIGEILHNSIAQLLYATQNQLQLIEPNRRKDVKALNRALEILSEAINDMRKISFELMPPVLKDYGLKESLLILVNRIFPEHITTEVSINLPKRLSENVEVSIYRVVQELLSNVLKHANASKLILEITEINNCMVIGVNDNGKGFQVSEVLRKEKGVGLDSIRNRIKALDGKIRFQSKNGEGTAVRIVVPL